MSEKRFDKIDEKMDDMTEKLSRLETAVSTGFAVYNKQLEIHIKATEQNKDAIKLTNVEVTKIQEDIEPLKDSMKFAKTLFKLLFALGTLAGMIIAILEYLK